MPDRDIFYIMKLIIGLKTAKWTNNIWGKKSLGFAPCKILTYATISSDELCGFAYPVINSFPLFLLNYILNFGKLNFHLQVF